MRAIENISQELFDKIRSRVSNIKLGTESGEVTTDPDAARFFAFTINHGNTPLGSVTISLNEEGLLQVYFPNSIVDDADSKTADTWYSFLKDLRQFASRNMLGFDTKNLTKERLDKKDYQFLTQTQDDVMEAKMYGSKQKSYMEAGTARLIVQHSKTVDETKLGARSRDIKAIYIENSDGERFKFINNYLPGARAMARHVSNEGGTKDDRGMHIVEIMDEMTNLKQFVRTVKSENYVSEDAKEVIEAASDRYYGLKDTLKAISTSKGYSNYFENWQPGLIEVEENDIADLKAKLTRQVFDDRIADTLPSVNRAMQHRKSIKMENINDLEAFANSPDNIEVYNNPADMAEMKNYVNFIRNSTMDNSRRQKALLVAIARYLSNNMTNDAMANAISEIEVSDKAQAATMLKLAMKYMHGKIDVKAIKAKKDLYGKDKVEAESATFESYAARMDKLAEGTWQLPSSESDVNAVIELMKSPLTLGNGGEDATSALGAYFGDDELFDDLGEAGDANPEGDARPIIAAWLEDKTGYDAEYQTYIDAIKAAFKIAPAAEGQVAEATGVCESCGCQIDAPVDGCNCAHDSHDASGDHWVAEEAVEEPIEEADDGTNAMIAKMKAMAGVGSSAKSNHGIHEGEAGYRITPRSLVAREMNKLRDIRNNK